MTDKIAMRDGSLRVRRAGVVPLGWRSPGKSSLGEVLIVVRLG